MFKWLLTQLQDSSYLYKQKCNEYYLTISPPTDIKKNPAMLVLRSLQSCNYFRESQEQFLKKHEPQKYIRL